MAIRLENLTAQRFRGWLMATVVPENVLDHGTVAGMPFVCGPPIGLRGRRLHVLADLAPGQVIEADPVSLDGPAPPLSLAPLPLGIPTVNGVALTLVPGPVTPDAPNVVHLRARISRMLVADLWVVYAPGQFWSQFWLLVTASNPAVPDMGDLLSRNLDLHWGDAIVQFLSGAGFVTALPAGESLGDGQARGFVGTIAWPSLMDAVQREAAFGFATGGIGMVDLAWRDRIGLLERTAEAPAGWDPIGWLRANYRGAVDRLRSWQDGPLGIVARSGNSGEQEDQGFGGKGSAVFLGAGFGAVRVLELVAMGWAKQPCHYLEADGSQLRLDIPNAENGLCLWGGRPINWCRDQRGKPRDVSELDTHGWLGPDNQHWFVNTLGAAWQLTGSPLLQHLLSAEARVFLYSQSLDPRLATSMPDASRAWGWMGMVAAWLWLTLEDRALAQMVKDRFTARLAIYRQAAGTAGLWDVRPNDTWNGALIGPAAEVWTEPNLPTPWPRFWLAYQQALGAGGLQIAGEALDMPEACALALEGALGVMDRCYQEDGTEWELLGVHEDGTVLPPSAFVDGRGAHRTGYYTTAWMPMGLWTVLRHQPENARARFLWDRAHALAAGDQGSLGHPAPLLEWLPPLT